MAATIPTTSVHPSVPAPAAHTVRDPWWDNAKMALVLLVVVGHAWTLLPHDGPREHLYDFLYLWHVTAFVLVSGYLSRSFDRTARRMWQLVRTVAVPYVLFEAAMTLFRVYVGGERPPDVFRDPHWPMWYRAVRVAAGHAGRQERPAGRRVAGAVAISLVGGSWADSTLDLYRVCGLLPFFVLGLVATPDRLERLRAPGARRTAVGVFVALAVLTPAVDRLASTDWLYYSYGYQALGATGLHAVAIRAGVLAVGAAGALAFLALVPRRTGWFTEMGAATLVVHLCHGLVVKGVEYAGLPGRAAGHTDLALVLTTLGAAGLALLLASRPVASRLADVVDPFGYAERHVRHGVALVAAQE